MWAWGSPRRLPSSSASRMRRAAIGAGCCQDYQACMQYGKRYLPGGAVSSPRHGREQVGWKSSSCGLLGGSSVWTPGRSMGLLAELGGRGVGENLFCLILMFGRDGVRREAFQLEIYRSRREPRRAVSDSSAVPHAAAPSPTLTLPALIIVLRRSNVITARQSLASSTPSPPASASQPCRWSQPWTLRRSSRTTGRRPRLACKARARSRSSTR